MQNCQATRADGRPCSARALPGEQYCWAHSPSLAAKRQQARTAGGYAKNRAARAQRLVPSQLRPVLGLLIRGLDEVHQGTLEPARYSAMAAGAGAITKLFATVDIEERLSALERKAPHAHRIG